MTPPLPTLAETRKMIDDIQFRLANGCGNHGCQIKQPTGMGTNSSCRCNPSVFAEELFYIGLELERYNRSRWGKDQHSNKKP